MKVLVSTYPYPGHFNPTQPVVRELVRRGHEVLWMTGPVYEDRVRATGAQFLAMSPDAIVDDVNTPKVQGLPTLSKLVDYLRRVFIDRIPGQIQDYQAAVKTFPAEVLLVDFCTFAARCFYDMTGLRYATLGINPLVTMDPEIPPWGTGEQPPKTCVGRQWNQFRHRLSIRLVVSKIVASFNAERKKLGLEPLDPRRSYADEARSPQLHIMMTTMAFEFPRKTMLPQARFVGPLLPVVDDKDFEPPTWLDELLKHPREKVVHITQGTVAINGNNLTKPTVRALADRDDLLVIVTGKNLNEIFEDADATGSDADAAASSSSGKAAVPTGLIPQPANVRTAAFVPHTKMLPYVGVMVTNAGYNGVVTALACGVPLVCAGQTEDKADVSSRVAWAGAGIDLRTSKPKDKAIRKAVFKIIADSKYREAAAKIEDDFAKHDGPAEAVFELEKLAVRCWADSKTVTTP